MREYIAFVDVEKARQCGLDFKNIKSPYSLWNSRLEKSDYIILPKDAKPEQYEKWSSDKNFVKLTIYGGN